MNLSLPSKGFFILRNTEYDAYKYFFGQNSKYLRRGVLEDTLDITLNYINRKNETD